MIAELKKDTAWIAVDWGTSNLRIWLMSEDDKPLKQLTSDLGMASLQQQDFERVLLSLIGPFLTDNAQMRVLCCGMVGSRQGWTEAKYLVAPCAPPSELDATHVQTKDPRIVVSILPGIKQASPADVMRGEETQIAGFLSQNPTYDGVICLPGTHSKWVRIKAGKINGFLSFMTGEIFALLSTKSILRHSMDTKGWDQAAFETAVTETLKNPELVAAKFFALRAKSLISDQSAATGLSRLSGLLVGLELAATKSFWQDSPVTLIGAETVAKFYKSCLVGLDVNCMRADVTTMTLDGLSAARISTKEDA